MDERAGTLERFTDLLKAQHGKLMTLCTLKTGKSLQGGINETRETVDLRRYYAQRTRRRLVHGKLRGPTGERNELFYKGHGIFACVSPWNFSLTIFLGQISAALTAGNTVLARSAEQTSLVAARIVELMFGADLPEDVIALSPDDDTTLGSVFCRNAQVVEVTLTGSADTAYIINHRLVEKSGAIAALITEIGGQSTVIVDSTTLPEQMTKDTA